MQDPNRTPRKGDHGRSNRSLFRRTIFLMVVLGIGMFLPLIAQLYKLQITEHTQWQERAANQQTKDIPVAASRGTIYDREGRTMALSATVYKLILSPMGVLGSVEEKNYDTEAEYKQALYDRRKLIVDWLVDTFGYDEEDLWDQIEYTASAYQVLARELEEEDAEKVREFTSKNRISGLLYLSPDSKRYYPYSTVGSHVLGYMSQNENSGENKVGAQGVEAMYEEALSGSLGRMVTSKNGMGMEMISGYEMYFDAEEGCDVTLTLDERIQTMLEQTLAEGISTYDIQKGAFGIAMNPKTGAILGMASTPDFDPNNYAEIISSDLQQELAELAAEKGEDSEEYKAARKAAWDKQWKNRALAEAYEPGSVFKPIVVSMALEEGIVSMDEHFFCGGGKVVGDRTISCHKHSGHGDQDLTHVVMNSCNVGMMTIAERMGPDIMWKYFGDFGLFDKTGIDLAGEGTQVFWAEDAFKGPYGAQSVAVSSFGQRFKVTPVQMISAFAAVINGGHLLEPYVVQSIADSDGNTVYYHETTEVRQVVSEETSDKVRGILEQVVGTREGSGHNASMNGYRIGGKTGTAEKHENPPTKDVICSFIGFAPADNPQILVLGTFDSPLRENGGQWTPGGTYIAGGNIAAPTVGPLIAQILDYMGIEKQYANSSELSKADVIVPAVTGKTLEEATALLQERNLTLRVVGDGGTVTAQIPASGASIPGGSSVAVYMGAEAPADTVTVPNVMGMSPRAVETALNNQGLYVRATGVTNYSGATSAIDQTIAAGTEVARGTVVEVRFADDAIGDSTVQ